MTSNKNKVLVLGGSEHKNAFLSKLLGVTPELVAMETGISKHDWIINNKAPIEFWMLPDDYLPLTPEWVATLHPVCDALIFLVDNSNESNHFGEWTSFIEEYSPGVLLCVHMEKCDPSYPQTCNHCRCAEATIEFVELHPEHNEDPDDYAPERVGIERVLEALESHTWENLVLKDTKQSTPVAENKIVPDLNEEDELDEVFARPINTGGSEPQEFTKSLETLTRFLKELDKDDDESDSEASLEERVKIFEKASLNLKKMRDDAQALPNEDRKRFAAMVVSTLFPEENFDDI